MLREIISRCKNVKYCAGNFTQDFGLDSEKDFNVFYNKYFLNKKKEIISEALGIDQTTVWRVSEKLLRDFAEILYFDLMNFNLLHPWG